MGAIRARIKYYEKSFLDTSNKTRRFTKTNINHIFRVYATFFVAFLLSYVISGVVSPVSNSSATDCIDGMIPGTTNVCNSSSADVNVSIVGAWSVAVSSSGTLGLDITPSGSGTLSTAVDNVNIYTNTPNGYQLYLNSTSGSTDIYNNNVLDESGNLDANLPSGTNTNHFSATSGTKASPASLVNNSWGYSLANNPSTFSKVEETSSSSDSLIRTTATKTTGSGDDIDVTYGFKADTKLTPGTYTTKVTYTAIAEVPNYTIQTVSPSNLTLDQGTADITIVTTTPSTELSLGDITASITNTNLGIDLALSNCTPVTTTSNGTIIDPTNPHAGETLYQAATCTYPGGTVDAGGLPVGTFNVNLTSSWHSATYTGSNLLTVSSPYSISTVSPNTWRQYDNGSKTITMVTNAPASSSTAFGSITAKIGTTSLSNCTAGTTDVSGTNYRSVSCTYPGGMAVGTYSIEFTASDHNGKTYSKASAITITSESYSISSVSPTTGNNNSTTTITMVTTALTSSSTALGTITGKIGNTNLTNCTATTSGNYRAAQCTIPSGVTAGTYTVQFTATGHNNTTYSKASAVTIRAYLTVSGGTGSGWYAPSTVVSISASACSTNYRFNNWTTTGGTIANANASSTTITTTTSNITVTRNCIINPYLTVSGGTGSGYYAPNSTISISANACSSGQTFNNWTTTGGTIANANATSTTITIGSSNVTVTRNCKTSDISGISTMQAMTSTICSNTTVGTSKNLTDTRDNSDYRVTKLKDGYCWMTENMRNASSGVANTGSYNTRAYGRLYTWSQALSICPTGWVLPPNSGARSYANLFNGTNYAANMSTAEASPLYFTRAGRYYGSSYYDQGSNGFYWSSTAQNSSNAYGFGYDTSGNFSTQGNRHKENYYSIRCVYGS